MLRVNSVKIQLNNNSPASVERELLKKLRLPKDSLKNYSIAKISIDARKKNDIHYVYSIDADIKNETEYLRKNRDRDIIRFERKSYSPYPGNYTREQVKEAIAAASAEKEYLRPIVIGSGPAGLFCAYKLACDGFKPLLLERGEDVDSRIAAVNDFWQGKPLKPSSNVQFGEGGAGTFSDGKLNTMVKDVSGRIGEVYRIFIENGAEESIAYMNKPHIGTDKLCGIVKNIRKKIIENGGEVRFNSFVSEIILSDAVTDEKAVDGSQVCCRKVSAVRINDKEIIPCERIVLAIGHSSRDTFEMLNRLGISMEQKPFAMGVRVQHPQELINNSQYGEASKLLPPADYKLTCNLPEGRSVYSFCMCPGGYVVNASSEEGRLCVNGMSYSGRDGKNANSAVVVSVGPKDYQGEDVLAGMRLQRRLEEKAFKVCNGKIPVQSLNDFNNGSVSAELLHSPDCKGGWDYADLNQVLPDYISASIKSAFPEFAKQIHDFDNPDTLLLGLESRTSSPVRILRNEGLQSINVSGLYPCGEGAGYAGGITSAAMDGLKIYEAILKEYVSE